MRHNYRLKLYQLSYTIVFLFAFYLLYEPINITTWVTVVTFSAAATIFDISPIVLPSSDDLSLVSPIMFTAALLFGVHTIFWINILTAVALIILIPKKWAIHFFNCVQYSLSGVIGFWTYNLFKISSTSLVTNLAAFIAFSISFYVINVILISTYLKLREDVPYKTIIGIFIDKKAILIYFTMMATGLIMATVVDSEGLLGFVIFFIILYFLSISYRSYYKMFDHFRYLSKKDELTNLYNHRYFQENLEEALQENDKVILLLIDIDHFKIYNDTFGHPKGDQLLKDIASIITNSIPHEGVACRYGGEEFTVILPNIETTEALSIAERIRKDIAEFKFEGREYMPKKRITVSIGVSTFPDMATSRKQLILLADQALYKSKYTSRNRVQLYASVIDELKGSFQFKGDGDETIQTLKTFLTIINSKDRYTYGHTERIMEYAELLAKQINLTNEEVKNIRYGALLHDIGKVEVASVVLNKVEKLEEDEWQQMKNHVIWGEQIVKPIKELSSCVKMIRHHHERYDGLGYPDQLKGNNIPLSARILTITDSFDAMTTDRPYKKGKSITSAVKEIVRCSGTQFDPKLVMPFVEVLNQLHPELQLDKYIDMLLNKPINKGPQSKLKTIFETAT